MPVNTEVTNEQWLRYRYCVERGHHDFVQKADKCDKFFAGDQWQQTDLDALTLARRPALTINKIISTISTLQGEQIYNRNEVLFRPAAGASSETADALSKVWMQIAQQNQLPWVRSDVFADGVIRSRGFYDVRLNFAGSMIGEVQIGQLNSKNVVIDPDAEEYDPDFWSDVFITKWLTYQDIATLYGQEDADYLKDRDGTVFPYAYDSIEKARDRFSGNGNGDFGGSYSDMDKTGVRRNIRVLERQHRKLVKQKHFVDIATGDTNPIPDGWDRNKIASMMERAAGSINVISKQVKRIRWTVTADHVALHDDWSPYQHFTVVPYFPQFRYGRTIGVVENLLSSQEMLNKVSSQELHVVNTTANSGWKVKAGALRNMSIEDLETAGAQTGLVLELDDITSAEKITPNSTPSGLDRISYKAEEHIKTISNISDSMQGNDREDVAAKAIAYKTQRGSVNMTKVLDNLERTDWILARNVLALVQGYYTEERMVRITHDDVTQEAEELEVNKVEDDGEILNDLTLGEYSIIITSTPYRASLEDSQFEQAKALRELGVKIPDSVLIENSRLMRRAEIVKQMQAEASSPQAQAEAALNMRHLEATVGKTEAEVHDKQADTKLKLSRAAKEDVTTAQEAQGGDGAEVAKLQMEERKLEAELEFKRQELEMKKEEMALKLQFEQQKHAQDMEMKQQQHQQDAVIKQQQAAQAAQQSEQQAAQDRDAHYAERAEKMKDNSGEANV
jgi:hypothetical protein